MLHRASMKYYADYLTQKGYPVTYINWAQGRSLNNVFGNLKAQNTAVVHYADTTDYLLERRLTRYCRNHSIRGIRYETPNFIFPLAFLQSHFQHTDRYFQTRFYQHARKSLNILMANGKPLGNRWSFDAENRKALPRKIVLPPTYQAPASRFTEEAAAYVAQTFPDNPGTTHGFGYATTFQDARQALDHFLANRLYNFGTYQDAIHPHHAVVFHSVLAPALNTGLLQPEYVLERTLEYALTHRIPLNSLEGFVRQLIGWREFIRAVYLRQGTFQRTCNFFGHSAPMPLAFYTGTTGVDPVDAVIHRVTEQAYAHHIERLMVMGNFMLLCEIHPDRVYQWFMELFIDAYDWVMVPNVYGMSQYADGGLMATKPYISSSNYILKMSSFSKDKWVDTWDGLYWRFLNKHQQKFAGNARMRIMLKLMQQMPKARQIRLFKQADWFLEKLYERTA